MSLGKAIEHGKEHRKFYTSKWIRRYGMWTMDCFVHNPKYCQCSWCRDNRLYKNNRRKEGVDSQLDEFKRGNYD